MQRCLQLAALGAGNTAPNPMVGAVLVHNNVIIGEGYHRQYGQPHAEVNCINSVKEKDKALIKESTLYVSLEPCAHFGKTPPCADLIVAMQIPKVVIGCSDSFASVNGKGIDKLKAVGIAVTVGVLEKEARHLNRRFFTFHEKQRPYIILKWAQSDNRQIANADLSKVFISNAFTNRLVHKWRSEEAAIMIGANTALHDNPSLTNRYWGGNNPVRIVLDLRLKVPSTHGLFSGTAKTIVFNQLKEEEKDTVVYRKLEGGGSFIKRILFHLHEMKILSVLVEGGAQLLQSFIDEGYWDEAIEITNEQLIIENGLAAPVLKQQQLIKTETCFTDQIHFYNHALQ